MLGQSSVAFQQISNYYADKVQARKLETQKAIRVIVKVVQDLLKDVEVQEPRFISTLMENNNRFEGVSSLKLFTAYHS